MNGQNNATSLQLLKTTNEPDVKNIWLTKQFKGVLMKSLSTIFALIVTLSSIAQADTTCELMVFTRGVQEPKKTPLVVKFQNSEPSVTALFAKDDNITVDVILSDKDQAFLEIDNYIIVAPLKFEVVDGTEIALITTQKLLDDSSGNYKKQYVLTCVKK